MLTLKIITEIIEKYSELYGGRIAAINLFQDDLDKSWIFLWHCYVRALVSPLPHPFQKARRQYPRHAPLFRRPCIIVVILGSILDAAIWRLSCKCESEILFRHLDLEYFVFEKNFSQR